MLIECDSCAGRGLACRDCLVTALAGSAEGQPEVEPRARFDQLERRAVDVLAWAGMLPSIAGHAEADPYDRAVACLVSQSGSGANQRRSVVDVGARRAG